MTAQFPEGFVWGASTSAFQIEGATSTDGRSESIWDRFAATPGKVRSGHTGEPACDHYNRWESDIQIMQELGLTAYSFTVSWPRVVPGGSGAVNGVGLDFYDRLVDGLLEAGIEPFVTLYHWDHPQIVEDRGGWRTRAIVGPFVDYSTATVERLGDRVRHWTTLNEPWVQAHLGYRTGQHAPGLVDSGTELDAAHHLLLSHGLATQAMRAVRSDLAIGIILNLEPRRPRSAHPGDVAAAELEQGLMNRWFLDPLTGRGYPPDLVEATGWSAAVVQDGDLESIAEPIDEFGLNYYRIEWVSDPSVRDEDRPGPIDEGPAETSTMGWPVTPEGLTEMLELVHGYGFESIYITENGGAFPDDDIVDGVVMDDDRLSFLGRHLEAASRAIESGIPLRGFMAWSLFDNFEWSFGYNERFGLVHVDFDTQQRTPKKSALWYRDVIARGGM